LIERGRIDAHRVVAAGDAVQIDVWIIKRRPAGGDGNPRGTLVLIHPLLCSKSWFLVLGGKLADMGWDIVLPDLRAHGRSTGEFTTWGAKEKHDVKTVMDGLVGEGPVSDRLFAVGASMGGAVAILYAAMEPRCRGVMALAPPKSCREICRRMMLMAFPSTYRAAMARAAELADFDPDEADCVAAAVKLRCPLLLIHGWWDFVVPYQHSRAILKAAREPKKLQPRYLAGHAAEFMNDGMMIEQIDVLEKMASPQITQITPM